MFRTFFYQFSIDGFVTFHNKIDQYVAYSIVQFSEVIIQCRSTTASAASCEMCVYQSKINIHLEAGTNARLKIIS